MDIISTQSLYDANYAKFSIGANNSTRFEKAFLGAYNDALMEMFNYALIDEPVLLTALTEDSTLTVRYLPIVKVGLKHFLQQEGEWVKGDSRDTFAFLNWQTALGGFANTLTQADEDAGTYGGPWGDN